MNFGDKLSTWQPGQSGNPHGRPKGSRHKLAEDFISDFQKVWEVAGLDALLKSAKKDPTGFIRVAASILPKDININIDVDPSGVLKTFREAIQLLGNDPEMLQRPKQRKKLIDITPQQEPIDVTNDD